MARSHLSDSVVLSPNSPGFFPQVLGQRGICFHFAWPPSSESSDSQAVGDRNVLPNVYLSSPCLLGIVLDDANIGMHT